MLGKSTEARRLCTGPYYAKQSENKWWCGYDYEEFVIIDDLTPQTAREQFLCLLHLCDYYVTRVCIKGATLNIRPKTIIITSTYSLIDCFGEEYGAQMAHRFNSQRTFRYHAQG